MHLLHMCTQHGPYNTGQWAEFKKRAYHRINPYFGQHVYAVSVTVADITSVLEQAVV